MYQMDDERMLPKTNTRNHTTYIICPHWLSTHAMPKHMYYKYIPIILCYAERHETERNEGRWIEWKWVEMQLAFYQ